MDFKELLNIAVENAPYYAGIPGIIEDLETEFPVEQMEDEILDTGRWSIHHRAVYRYMGRFWAVDYDEPATENQDWDHDYYTIKEVTPVTKTIVAYERLKV